PLVARGDLVVVVGRPLAGGLVGGVGGGGGVGRLPVQGGDDAHRVAVIAELAGVVADVADHGAGDIGEVEPRGGGDLAGDHDQAGGQQGLHRHPRGRVLAQRGV